MKRVQNSTLKLLQENAWVIIPAYNEEKYIQKVLKKVGNVTSNIVVVDDGSKDKTFAVAKNNTPHVLKHSVNLGKGAALKTGCEFAFLYLNASAVVFFDADDQHEAQLIPQMVSNLEKFPVVLGVRAFNNNMPLVRIILNRLISFLLLLFFGNYIPDIPSGFKAIRKDAYSLLRWRTRDYLVEMEIAARIARKKIPYTTIEIPTIYHDLDRGMTLLDSVHIFYYLLSWRIGR